MQKIKVNDEFEDRIGGGGVHVCACVSKLGGKTGLISRLSAQSYTLLKQCAKEKEFSLLSPKVHDEACSKSILSQRS